MGTDFYLPGCSNPITTGVALENQMNYLIALRKENQEKRVVGIMWQELPCAPFYLNRPTVAPGETPAWLLGARWPKELLWSSGAQLQRDADFC